MNIVARPDLHPLADVVRGRCWFPGDDDFERAHRPWNLAIEQPVHAVVEAADARDVARVVGFARDNGAEVATQPNGHGATGRAAGTILLRTTRLDAITIDPDAMTASIGAGVRSGDLQRAAAAHGLTALPGSSPVVTVAGAALGGGLSWFGRAFGWIGDSILAADVVLADGTSRHLSAESDPELLWALRGGAGDLVIVTSLRLRLRPAPALFGGRQLWSAADSLEVARAYREMTATAPESLTLWLELLHFPGAEPMIAIDSTFLGEEDEARALLATTDALPAPLSDTRATMTVADIGSITAEPTDPGPGRSRGELLTRLGDDDLVALVADPIAPLMTVQLRHLGGALARPSDSAHGALDEPYAVYMFGVPATPEIDDQIAAKQASLAARLPTSGRKPITFLNPSETLSDALAPEAIERLARLKDAVDPDDRIRGNVGIREAV